MRRGKSLELLARPTFKMPSWLLRQYKPDLDFDSDTVSIRGTVPKLKPFEDSAPATVTSPSAGGSQVAVAP